MLTYCQFIIAAKHLKEIAEMYEQEQDLENAYVNSPHCSHCRCCSFDFGKVFVEL